MAQPFNRHPQSAMDVPRTVNYTAVYSYILILVNAGRIEGAD
jgi:hypothetical protein